MSEPNDDLTSTICGIDEAGRGPLAGPVTAAAVILKPSFNRSLLKDSKVLSLRARERAFDSLMTEMCPFGIGWAWPEEIDRINIHNASLRAMQRAYQKLTADYPSVRVSRIIVDGRFRPQLPGPPCSALVGGDHIEPAIMAAGIVAKVTRDRWMIRYSQEDGRYGFETHKGYPTAEHRAALQLHGASPIHRHSFRGVMTHATNQAHGSVEESASPAPVSSDPLSEG